MQKTLTKDEIIKRLKQNRDVLAKYKIKQIGLFGSYARGEQEKTSDVDILVEFSEIIDFFEFLEIEEYLTGILGAKVDLVMKPVLKPEIGKHILSEVVYA
jgi:uncharacterized protein